MSIREANTFHWLWAGQLISNVGTQTSLYGIGLWLFGQTERLLDFGLVALVVQLARVLALPLLASSLNRWPPGRLMLLAHFVGALCTASLAFLLLAREPGSVPALLPLLSIQGLAAMAEATLVLRFSSLIPLLIRDGPALIRANGLFATADGLVVTLAPFMGTWLVGTFGLKGVLLLDGISFLIAMVCVLRAPWSEVLLQRLPPSLPERRVRMLQLPGRLKALWNRSSPARVALLLSAAVMFVYAGCEILFPAWVSAVWGPQRMAIVLILGGLGYLLGFGAWRWRLGQCWEQSGAVMLLIQALILLGAALNAFAEAAMVWCAAVLIFSLGLPIVMASLHQRWVELAPKTDLPRYFALRYGCEWSSRLLAFLGVSLIVDQLVRPAMHWSWWPNWMLGLFGTGVGRPMALSLSGLGWILLLVLLQRHRWQTSTTQ